MLSGPEEGEESGEGLEVEPLLDLTLEDKKRRTILRNLLHTKVCLEGEVQKMSFGQLVPH